jgi:beta-glucoside operon transcriptional antiterminator
MKIKKVFNNNVVLTEDSNQTELVVMGRGLAFQKKIGDQIEVEKIEKTFIISSDVFVSRFSELIEEIPYEIMIVSQDIIDMASDDLQSKLNDSLYLSLSDHIHFAITRSEQGVFIKNALMWEMQKFYRDEYRVAKKALDLIEERLAIRLPEDEIASIALHLLNARQDGAGMEETLIMTNIVKDVSNIVKYHFNIDLDEDSMNYSRFITHLRYFSYRMLRGEFIEGELDVLYEQVCKQYPEASACATKVKKYLNEQYQVEVTKDELAYFIIHIHRVTSREKRR